MHGLIHSLACKLGPTYGRRGMIEPTYTLTIRVGKEGRPEEAFSLSSDRKLNGTTISSMAIKLKRITAASAFDLLIEQLEVGSH